jgi:hypothetical protein
MQARPSTRKQDALRLFALASLVFALFGSDAMAQFFRPAGYLDSTAGSDSGTDLRPEVAADGEGTWVAVWLSRDPWDPMDVFIGSDADILVARSTDNGATWSASHALNTNAATDTGDDTSPYIATDGSGLWIAVWETDDTLGGTLDPVFNILMSRSTDAGVTWSAPEAIYSQDAGDPGSGLEMVNGFATDGLGTWVVVWTTGETRGETIGSDFDVMFARSTDDGETWTESVLNTNAATDSGLDVMASIATGGTGTWIAVWTSDEDLGGLPEAYTNTFTARSTDHAATWSAPAVLNSNAPNGAMDWTPTIETDGAGNWMTVWSSSDTLGDTIGVDRDLLISRSSDDGASWTPAAVLNSNAYGDSGADSEVDLATDGTGFWLAVWGTTDSLGDTIGTDTDMVWARSFDFGATWSFPQPVDPGIAAGDEPEQSACIASDGEDRWLLVWTQDERASQSEPVDHDVFVTRALGTGVPALSHGGRVLLLLLLLGAGIGAKMRRSQRIGLPLVSSRACSVSFTPR